MALAQNALSLEIFAHPVMKLQYLGDSKDSFKWDYHDYLTSRLKAKSLNVILMMTPDDESNDGTTPPERFPARPAILDFCKNLQASKDVDLIKTLPAVSKSHYGVKLHKKSLHLVHSNREVYFSDIYCSKSQVIFCDPDNGFEPTKSRSEKHILYSEVESIIGRMSGDSVVSVFQNFRRKSFKEDYADIRERLSVDHVTGVFWHSLMFVVAARSRNMINRVYSCNRAYAAARPVTVVAS